MDIQIKIDSNQEETKIVIYAKQMTTEILELVQKLSDRTLTTIAGYRDNNITLINPEDIIRIYAQNQKVFAQVNQEYFLLRYRLYELDEMLKNTQLVRISNSEIVNFKKVLGLSLSLYGTITLNLVSGEKAFVSRRYVEKIKKRIGL